MCSWMLDGCEFVGRGENMRTRKADHPVSVARDALLRGEFPLNTVRITALAQAAEVRGENRVHDFSPGTGSVLSKAETGGNISYRCFFSSVQVVRNQGIIQDILAPRGISAGRLQGR